MQHAATGRHSARRNDHGRNPVAIDLLRLLGRCSWPRNGADSACFGSSQAMVFRMRPEYLAGVHGHRAVEEDRQVRDALGHLQMVEMVEEQLRPAYREGGYDNRAALVRGCVDDLSQRVLGVGWWMLPVAVCGLDNEVVRLGDRLGRPHSVIFWPPQIARKEKTPTHPHKKHHRGAQDVPCVSEGERRA